MLLTPGTRLGPYEIAAPLGAGGMGEVFRAFPEPVKDLIGHALFIAQLGGRHEDAKPSRGFGGAGVLKLVGDFAGDTYRAVYTVKFADAICVLHAFQKKSKRGIKTPQRDLDLIKERLRRAEKDHASWSRSGASQDVKIVIVPRPPYSRRIGHLRVVDEHPQAATTGARAKR